MNLDGAIDLHVHADPSLFPRWGDVWDLVRVCQSAGMGGVVVKFHHGSSVEVARVVDAKLDGFRVFGGVVLNRFVGGLNPYAVESSVQLGAKIVWLPTIHATEHGCKVGPLGGFSFQSSAVRSPATDVVGLTLLDEDKRLLPEVADIVRALDGTDVVLATGHVAVEEILALLEFREKTQANVKVLVNHCFFSAPGLTVEQIRELPTNNVWLEIADLSASPLVHVVEPSLVAQAVLAVPNAQWVLVSDSGQAENLHCPDALRRHMGLLNQHGVSEEQIMSMVVDRPRALLGLEAP